MSDFGLVTCCECGIEFGLRIGFLERLKGNGNIFSCPNGHEQAFTSEKSKIKKLEEELDIVKMKSNKHYYDARYYKRSASAYKGKLTIEKRKAKQHD